MDPNLSNLLKVDQRDTFEFFVTSLREVVPQEFTDRRRVRQPLFAASILAHYAQTSTATTTDMPALSSMIQFFETFVIHDSGQYELAGAQCLVFNGFFRDQICARHNVNWFDYLGSGYFRNASRLERSEQKRELLFGFSLRFSFWAQTFCQLSRNFRDTPYLLPKFN